MDMDMNEFMRRMLEAFPQAEADQDNDGQLVIYTGLREREDGEIVPFEEGR